MILIEARIKFCGQLVTEIFFSEIPKILTTPSAFYSWKIFENLKIVRFWEIEINETFINQVQLGFIRCKIIILIQSDVTFQIL